MAIIIPSEFLLVRLSVKSPVCGIRISEVIMIRVWGRLWEEEGQDIAEYAVMLAVILAVVVGTIRLIGSGANNVFSSVASSIQ